MGEVFFPSGKLPEELRRDDIAFQRYRREVVRRAPDSEFKKATLAAIEYQIETLTAEPSTKQPEAMIVRELPLSERREVAFHEHRLNVLEQLPHSDYRQAALLSVRSRLAALGAPRKAEIVEMPLRGDDEPSSQPIPQRQVRYG